MNSHSKMDFNPFWLPLGPFGHGRWSNAKLPTAHESGVVPLHDMSYFDVS